MMSRTNVMWQRLILPLDSSIEKAIQVLNETGLKIILVTKESGAFVGTISDGDIRRGLLRGLNLQSSIDTVINRDALVVTPYVNRERILEMMMTSKVQQIPIIDEKMYVVGLHLWDEMDEVAIRDNYVVIMAGGKGKRLMPLTSDVPKPMILLGEKPILEHIINRAKSDGFLNFKIAIGYLGDVIESYFKDGSNFGVSIEYIREDNPLGTIGALSIIDSTPTLPFIVTNSDLVTKIKFSDLLDFHVSNSATASMAIVPHELQNPYGVVKTSGLDVIGFEEKPIVKSFVNAGVYAFSPGALSELNYGEHCDAPTLFDRIRIAGLRTLAFPVHEDWKDIGLPNELSEAILQTNKEFPK
jgi:dTDP-glucose pyrophosphorylase